MRAARAAARAGFLAVLLLLVVPGLLFGPFGAPGPVALADVEGAAGEAGLEANAFVLPLPVPAPDPAEAPGAPATPVPAPALAQATPTSIATPIPATPTPLPLREAPFEIPGMLPFAAAVAPFDARARHELALDALTYFVRQQGHFPGHSVFQLPAPVWLTRQGLEEESDPDAPPRTSASGSCGCRPASLSTSSPPPIAPAASTRRRRR